MDMHPEVAKAVPGVLGSITAVLLMRAPWKTAAAIVLPGTAMAYYGGAWVGHMVGMPETLAGYLVGVGGMAFMAKVLETWQRIDFEKWIEKLPFFRGGQ